MKIDHLSEARVEFDQKEVFQKLQDVVKKLGFKVILNSENNRYVEAGGKDKYHHFGLWIDTYKGKVNVRYHTPDGMSPLGDYITKPYDNIGVSLSPTKSADQMAKDIQRRFMDNFEKLAAIYAEQDEKNQTYTNRREEAIRKIAKVIGKKLPEKLDDRDFPMHFGDNTTIKVRSGNHINLEIDVSSADEAIKIIKLLEK